MWHSLLPDPGGECARVDSGKTGDIVCLEPTVECAERTVIRRMLGIRPHHHSAHRRAQGLNVFDIRSDDADMGKGENDDLSGVGRIAEDLLISCHRGVEADFAHRLTVGAEGPSLEHCSIGQHKGRARKPLRLVSSGCGSCKRHEEPRVAAENREGARQGQAVIGADSPTQSLRCAPAAKTCRLGLSERCERMNLRDRFSAELKEAMKAKEQKRVGALRLILAALKERDIANRSETSREGISDDEILSLLAKMVKQREESAAAYEGGGRPELAKA